MRYTVIGTIGVLLVLAGLLGTSLAFPGSVVYAQDGVPSAAHEQMHKMMDAMMGDGFSARMHAEMPGSEAMMENCAQGMEQTGTNPDDMMSGGHLMQGGR